MIEIRNGLFESPPRIPVVASYHFQTIFGMPGYGGPCPPEGHGPHQYVITIHALSTDKLGLDANANPALVGYYLWQNTIEKASVVYYYQH